MIESQKEIDDRGASELVGVMILFGIVAIATLSVVVMGSSLQEDLRQESEFESARMDMQRLDERLGSVSNGAGGGHAAVDLSDSTDDDVRVVEQASEVRFRLNGATVCTASVDMGSVVYTADDGDALVYEGGAIWEVSAGGRTMVSPPDLDYREGTVNFDVKTLSGAAGGDQLDLSVDRSESRQATADVRSSLLSGRDACTPGETLTIAVTSPHHEAWYAYLVEEMPDGSVTDYDHNDTVVVHLGVDDLAWGDDPGDDDGDDAGEGDDDGDGADDGDEDGDGDDPDDGPGDGDDEPGEDDEDDGDDESESGRPIDVIFVYEEDTHQSLTDDDYNLSTFTANLRDAGLDPKYGGGSYFEKPNFGSRMVDPGAFGLHGSALNKGICIPDDRLKAPNPQCDDVERRDLTDALYAAADVDYDPGTPTVIVHFGEHEALDPSFGEYPTQGPGMGDAEATHDHDDVVAALEDADADFYSITPARKTLYYGCNGYQHHDAREIATDVGGTWFEENVARACNTNYGAFDLDDHAQQIETDLVDQYAPDGDSAGVGGGWTGRYGSGGSVASGYGGSIDTEVPSFSSPLGSAVGSVSLELAMGADGESTRGAALTTVVNVRVSHVEIGDADE